jgi:hypothetical protein
MMCFSLFSFTNLLSTPCHIPFSFQVNKHGAMNYRRHLSSRSHNLRHLQDLVDGHDCRHASHFQEGDAIDGYSRGDLEIPTRPVLHHEDESTLSPAMGADPTTNAQYHHVSFFLILP